MKTDWMMLCAALVASAGCSSEDAAVAPDAAIGIGGVGGSSGSGSNAGSAGASVDSGLGGGPGDAGAAGSPGVPSPVGSGPYATTVYAAIANVAATGNAVPIKCFVPSAPAGPVPLVVLAHGFQLPASQYEGTAAHAASFGFVVCTADFPAGFTPDHLKSAQDLLGSLDFLIAASGASGNPVSGRVDAARLALSGHSLGGKLSVLAASMDARVKVVVALDPVDSAMLCNPTQCPDASDKLPLAIPMAFLGETLDATGTFQACAPKADNFETFFAKASPPSLRVTLQGANHMSFIDDPTSCGTVCGFCNPATMPQVQALEISRAYLVSFLSRHLLGHVGYDSWLSGVEAQTRWVAPKLATIETKE